MNSQSETTTDLCSLRGEPARAQTEESPVVLIVTATESNRRALKTILRDQNYRLLTCAKATEALDILSQQKVALLIVDPALPGTSGAELCRWLKVNLETQLIPVLMLSGSNTVRDETEAFRSGADDFVARPLNPALVRARIAALLRQKSMTDLLENAESILFSLAQAVERRDRFTGEHCHRLAVYSVALGKAAGVPPAGLLALYRGGYLHDIGKIGIPDAILFKPAALNAAEWEIMRSHPARGEEICRPMKSVAAVLPIIRYHHERWDGSGYPEGLRGEEIPLLARILQVCDIYDALTAVRSYKPALSHQQAIEVIREETRRGWRDPDIVSLFLHVCQNSLAGIMTPGSMEFSGMLSMHHAIVASAFDSAAG